MQLHRRILIYTLGFLLITTIESYDDATGYSSPLERKLTLKLKTAARLKHNFGKVLHELPVLNYEFYHSVKTIGNYLGNGGSLIECLEILPSVMYASIKEQMGIILGSMENNLPKYLIPTISLLKRSFLEGVLDANEIYRPNWGPLKSDLLEKIPLKELQEAVAPLNYREPIKGFKGPWPKLIGETASLINDKIIPSRRELIAYILLNLRIPDATAEIRESVAHLVEYLQQDSERELFDFKTFSDPYELVANTISSLPLRNETLIAANILLPFLKKPAVCQRISELDHYFRNNVFNYTLLLSRERIISKTRAGSALMFVLEQNSAEVQDIVKQFSPFEHVAWKNLLLAFISQLRRHRSHLSKVSDVVDNIYGELVLRNVRKRWRLLRNQVIAKTVFSAVGSRESSARIQRLLADVGLNKDIRPTNWRKALTFASDDDIGGPINATLKTLKALLASRILSSDILKANVAELVDVYDNRLERSKCGGRLESYLTNLTHTGMRIDESVKIASIDVKDLLQALRDLDIYTDEYKSLQSFLSRDDLEMKIGKVNVNAYPTRGRLLYQLLQMLEHAINVDNDLRYLAKQFIDNVAYDGYGAGILSLRSTLV
ncbi:PREDICTED: uncharacterized protein LOC106750683 [Dinoponera quadriceps]|uniref:Uncharacterized protein LOC106750683 n=1 Tax=Dinoponera quadriceps TaxID=609295 RepID=A0A6P3Y9J2_DINQU|nr:PREDICTED: uncharacterized protein LOC106750683 [Dinoponera quadriceps]